MMACEICYCLDVETYFFETEGCRNVTTATRMTSGNAIAASASTGCHGCSLLAKGLSLPGFKWEGKLHILFHSDLPLRIESSGFDMELFVPPGVKSTSPCIGPGRNIPQHLTAKIAAEFAQKHLQKCQDQHEFCLRSSMMAANITGPQRLIDLGSGSNEISEDMSLVDVYGSRRYPYIAISYCWGSLTDNSTTTVSNMNMRKSRIRYIELPKTLQDAVDITRALKIQYIWIDSLCIIQDSVENRDWHVESAKMASIYQGAILTLAATRSPAVSSGFLGSRDPPSRTFDELPEERWSHVIEWTNFSGETEEVFVRQRINHSAIVGEDSRLPGCPLLSRGWTFQERLMSTRTLHFLQQEMIWECKSDFGCECLSIEADQSWKKSKIRGSLFNRMRSGELGSLNWTTVWTDLITEYSKRLLTNEADRLPAIYGIARQFQGLSVEQIKLGRYLAGHWEENFVWQLTWQAVHIPRESFWPNTQHPSHNPRSQRDEGGGTVSPPFLAKNQFYGSFSDSVDGRRKRGSPSWSWASTPYPVKWDTALHSVHGEDGVATLISVSYFQDLINPLSKVTPGHIVLEADIVSTTIANARWELQVSTDDTWTWRPPIVLIPDTSDLGLCNGDTIHCTEVYRGIKGGEAIWVALGLRHLAIPEDSITTTTDCGANNSDSDSEEDSACESPTSTVTLESPRSILKEMNPKYADNLRPVHHGGKLETMERLETYYRVGLVKGSGLFSPFNRSNQLFSNSQRRKIIIV